MSASTPNRFNDIAHRLTHKSGKWTLMNSARSCRPDGGTRVLALGK
jgi:hypothetical protein